jgi:acyl carrier protein
MGMDAIEIIMEVEEELSVDLNDEELSSGRTVADLARAASTALDRAGRPKSAVDVLETIRSITATQLGIPLEKVHPESRFRDDLGAD